MLQVGIAGVGGLGTMHLRTLLAMNDKVNVAALADPIEDRRAGAKLTSETNLELEDNSELSVTDVRSYEDYSELCADTDLDVVFIATPSDLHAEAAVIAMENGKHVFTEKPMALNSDDCQRMIDAASTSGKTLMVGQCLRFFPEYMAAHDIMTSGDYGKPLAVTMNRYGGQPGRWFAEIERSGGVNLDLHIHDIDAALWLWGKPDKATSRTMGVGSGSHSVLSQWEYTDGPVVQLEASWQAARGFQAEFRIMLESAVLRYRGGKLLLRTPDGEEEVELSGPGGHAAEVHYFIDCVLSGDPVTRCLPTDSALSVAYALGQI
jgi:predicted dehydrogenase